MSIIDTLESPRKPLSNEMPAQVVLLLFEEEVANCGKGDTLLSLSAKRRVLLRRLVHDRTRPETAHLISSRSIASFLEHLRILRVFTDKHTIISNGSG